MNNKKNYGFTLIELLAVIVVLAIILAVAIPSISGIIQNSAKGAFESDAKMVLKAIEYKILENNNFDPLTITKANMQQELKISSENYSQVTLSIVNNKVKIILVGVGRWNGLTAYGTSKNMNVVNSADYDEVPPVITITGNNPETIRLGGTYTESGATASDIKDGDVTSDIVTTGTVNTAVLGTYTITYTVKDSADNQSTATRTVNVEFSANDPVLATGMTPIKWNGSAWVDTTTNDYDWYNYTTSDKKWANARTADGSMWVWIPRYIYKISSGWHTNTAGTIDVQFSMGTDDTRGGTVTLDTGTTTDASNNKWTNHPAFTFDTTELTGIWVAKFEASGAADAVDIKPNLNVINGVTIGYAFSIARDMETKSRYGWGTSGTGIDTHMMKNIEWGAVAYLSKSVYGKGAEIWINPSSTFVTGCAGASVSETSSSGCSYAYNTSNGQQASTTGNIYGIYGMSGGAYEYTAAYVNNGSGNLGSYGSSIVSAISKYKDIYTVTTDSNSNNYNNAANKKGDALYEVSSSYSGNTSWYGDSSNMAYGSNPWFIRGGVSGDTTAAGVFYFGNGQGLASANYGFRPTLLVGAGL